MEMCVLSIRNSFASHLSREFTPTQDLQESIVIIGIDHYKMQMRLCCQDLINSIVIDPKHVDLDWF